MSEKPLRLLLVEGDENGIQQTRSMLQKGFGTGCEIEAVGLAERAIQRLRGAEWDAVLLDATLPHSEASKTVWRIHEAAPDTALVVLTGDPDPAGGLEAIRQGAQDFLVKGRADADILARAVRYAVERKRFERELKRHHGRLQDLVDEATRDLLDANEQLQREVRERKAA